MDSAGFRTNDMALVAYLAVRHIPHSRMELADDEVAWFFNESDALSRELDGYRLGQAQAEPVALTRQLSRTRREMFEFKDAASRVA